jgi:hypothetical protein
MQKWTSQQVEYGLIYGPRNLISCKQASHQTSPQTLAGRSEWVYGWTIVAAT